jgi:hypothetical protein
MAEFSWSELLAGSAAGVAIREVVSYWRKKNEMKVDLSSNVSEIYHLIKCMEEIVDNTTFDRMMILKGEDSAGILAAGKKLYVSAQYEKMYRLHETMQPTAQLIQRWEADHEYYKIFSDMLTNGVVKVLTSNMPDSKLKDTYTAQGVKYSELGHLMTTNDSSTVFYYQLNTSVSTHTEAEDRNITDGNVSIIKSIFAKHKKFYN